MGIPEKKVFIIGESTFTDDCFGTYRIPQPRTFRIEKITKCFIFWTELDTNCYNNNHKIFRKKKQFCDVRNCEYFKDNSISIIYANGTYI
jgi:hypothetical protein